MAARGQKHRKGKNKQDYAPKPKIPPPSKKEDPAKDSICHDCGEIGHSKRNYPQYLAELLKKKKNAAFGAGGSGIFVIELNTILNRSWIYDTGCGTHICNTMQGLRASRKLKPGLLACTSAMVNVKLLKQLTLFIYDGFVNRFVDNTIQVSRNNMVYFCAIPRDDLDSALLWHCRLGHISKKRIEKLQHDGLLDSSNLRAFEKCVSCLSGKMARKPYTHQHKHEVFETFKVLQKEVENQLGKTIKWLRSDRGGEYMSQEFLDHLKDHEIIAHRSPPYTPQHNAKKVAPKLSYLKVWGCEALVKRDTLTKPDKLEPRSIKCIFVRYPKETIGYSFYYPPENKEEDTHPSFDTSLNHKEDDLEIDEPQSDIVPIRRSTRIRHAPDLMCLYIDAEEHDLGDLGEPANYKAALLDPEFEKWLNAMNVEMQSMKDNEVWILVELPPNGKTVGKVYMEQPEGFVNPKYPNQVCKLKRSIHGLKQASRQWNKQFDDEIKKSGVTQNHDESCVYLKVSKSNITFLILYVDDILIMENNIPMLQSVKTYLGRCFSMQDLGEAAYILGIKIYIDRSRRLIGLCQSAYIEKILKQHCMENSKRRSSIMYVVRCTRPDVAFAQNVTSRFQQNPYDIHWTTIKNILKYLRNTKDMFLVYGGDLKRELKISCYTDAGYLTDADDLKSQTGYVFVLNGSDVDWKSAKQSIFATSSAEAEYIAAFDAPKETVWVRKFISGLSVVPTIEEPISVYCDNTRAIAIANESGITKGVRHFRAKVHYLREVIEYGDIKLEKFTQMTT
nr:hypothetical protein [Tanacetum cinerariifolium]